MNKANEYTKVIFRDWQDDIIAIFPEIPGDMDPAHCLSYQHIGQHGTCDPEHIIKSSKPANESQYQALKAELESIGYNLRVVTRQSTKDLEIRQQELTRV